MELEHLVYYGEWLETLLRKWQRLTRMLHCNRSHAARYEREFMEDLTLLNCRLPDVMTRVSEYMDEIKAYVQQIYENGMAYAVNGSVYFDTQAYRCASQFYVAALPLMQSLALSVICEECMRSHFSAPRNQCATGHACCACMASPMPLLRCSACQQGVHVE